MADEIQEDKFQLNEGDIEWVTSPDASTSEDMWALPTTSLKDVLDAMGVPERFRRQRVRALMATPLWRHAPRNIMIESIRMAEGAR